MTDKNVSGGKDPARVAESYPAGLCGSITCSLNGDGDPISQTREVSLPGGLTEMAALSCGLFAGTTVIERVGCPKFRVFRCEVCPRDSK